MDNMRTARRSRRPRETQQLGASFLGQPPLRNHLKPIEPMSQDQLMAIHEASLRLLEDVGIEFMVKAARQKFREAGASVDEGTGQVRIPRELITEALKTAPSSFVLTPRNPARRLHIGENHISFSLVAGPPNIHDCVNGRRSGNYKDY